MQPNQRSPANKLVKTNLLKAIAQNYITKKQNNPNVNNFLWRIADQAIRIGVAMIVGGWTARYLGPANFGLLNYSIAIVSIFAVVAQLSFDDLAVQEIIKNPIAVGEWIGTIIGFRLLAATLCAIIAFRTTAFFEPRDSQTGKIVAVLSLGFIGQALESGAVLFQTRGQIHRLIQPRLLIFFLVSGIKILAIHLKVSLLSIAALVAVEQIANGIATYVLAKSQINTNKKIGFEAKKGWDLLSRSWPLVLSSLSIILYLKSSQILLSQILDDEAVGLYAVAIRLSEAIGFVPMALSATMLPSLYKKHTLGKDIYTAALIRYFRLNSAIALLFCSTFYIIGPKIILVLYGIQFEPAIPVMKIHLWTIIPIFLGVARSLHLINESLTLLSLFFAATGLTSNVILSYLLIPRFGVIGAAWSSLLSYTISAVLSSFMSKKTRKIGILQVVAIITPWRIFNNENKTV